MIISKAKNLINRIGWKNYSRKLRIGSNSYVATGYEFTNPQNIIIGKNFTACKNLKLQTWPVYRGEETGYSPQLTIGDNVSIMDNVQISCMDKITIGNGVLMGDNVFISDNFHGDPHNTEEREIRPLERPLYLKGEINIGDKVWIGRNVCIFGGVHIGRGAVIGANSVVTHDVPENSVAGGVPAKVLNKK